MVSSYTNSLKAPRWSVSLSYPDGIGPVVSKALSRLFKIIWKKGVAVNDPIVVKEYVDLAWKETIPEFIPFPVKDEHNGWVLCYDEDRLKEIFFSDFLEAFLEMMVVYCEDIKPLCAKGKKIRVYSPAGADLFLERIHFIIYGDANDEAGNI